MCARNEVKNKLVFAIRFMRNRIIHKACTRLSYHLEISVRGLARFIEKRRAMEPWRWAVNHILVNTRSPIHVEREREKSVLNGAM